MPAGPPPAPPPTREGERIAKLLARAGVASRREVERMIGEGRVAHDGAVLTTPATLLGSLAGVTVDGQPVAAAEAARLFLYHKPVGLLVTERDPRGRPTIYDRLPADLPRLVPVGRLDLATEGLLLLTTDGGLKRQLELPATGVERSYRARAYGRISQARLEELIEGIEIDGVRYGRIDANLERRTGANVWIELTLTEGKNREVRRVLEHLGLQVGRLIRTRYGPFVLGDLPPGAIGEVRAHDVDSFRAHPTRPDLPQPARRGGTRAEASGHPRHSTLRAPSPPRRETEAAATPPKDEGAPLSAGRASGNFGGGRDTTGKPADRSSRSADRAPRAVAPRAIAKPKRANRAAAHRQAGGRDEPPAPRAAKPVRKPGWARPKPKSGPRGPKRK